MVRAAEVAAPDFDARFSALWRRYRYTVLNRRRARPVPGRHDVARRRSRSTCGPLRLACDPLIGEHDFSSFCRRPKLAATASRRPRWSAGSSRPAGTTSASDRRLLRFEIAANAFCHQMVRSIVGTLVEVGQGKRSAGSILGTLRARDRAAAGQLAPPHGLCLWEVGYSRGDGQPLSAAHGRGAATAAADRP